MKDLKSWIEWEKGKGAKLSKREHGVNDREKTLDVKEKELAGEILINEKEKADIEQSKKDFQGKLDNLKELIIKAMDKW